MDANPLLDQVSQPLRRDDVCIGRFGIEPIMVLTAVVVHRCKAKPTTPMLVWATPTCAVYCVASESATAGAVAHYHPEWVVGTYLLRGSATQLSHETIVADLQARCAELLTAKESRCFSET